MSYGVGCRHGVDLALLWLWSRPAVVAPIPPLAWELPYAVGVAIKNKNNNKAVPGPLWAPGGALWQLWPPAALTRTMPGPSWQVEAIEYYTKLEQKLKEDYKREKEKVNEKPLGMAFVTFHNETITAM